MPPVSRFISQGFQKLQSGMSQVAARASGYTKLPGSSKHAQSEGMERLGARQGRPEGASMAPRKNTPHAAMHQASAHRPSGPAAPLQRPAPQFSPRPGMQQHPTTAAQHFMQSQAAMRPQKASSRPTHGHSTAPQAQTQARPQAQSRPVAQQPAAPQAHSHSAARPAPPSMEHVQSFMQAQSRPVAKPQNAARPAAPSFERAESHVQARPAAPLTHAQKAEKLQGMVEALTNEIKATDRPLHQLIMAKMNAETDAEYDEADAALNAMREQRKPLIETRNNMAMVLKVHVAADHLGALRGIAEPEPVNIHSLKTRRGLMSNAEALRTNASALRDAREKLGPSTDFGKAHKELDDMLKSGRLSDWKPGQLAELQDLAQSYKNYAELERSVLEADKVIRSMGGMGMMDGIPTTQAERDKDRAEELAREQERIDQGYL